MVMLKKWIFKGVEKWNEYTSTSNYSVLRCVMIDNYDPISMWTKFWSVQLLIEFILQGYCYPQTEATV